METIKLQTWRKYICCQSKYYTVGMQRVLANLDGYIQHALSVLKDDRTSTVVLVKIDEHLFVVKRANTKNILHGLRRCFAVSRAWKNWQNARILLKNKIPTFEPVAFVEERIGPLKGRSYFIYPYLEGALALHYFAGHVTPQAHWPQVIRQIKALLNDMLCQGISHRDLNLSNIILINHQPWLIDLDAMRQFHPKEHFRVASRERGRFLENCQDATDISPQTLALFRKIFAE